MFRWLRTAEPGSIWTVYLDAIKYAIRSPQAKLHTASAAWRYEAFNDTHTAPLDLPLGTPYPIKGGACADLRCLPLPDIERLSNPNLGS
jgi:hypothetical protein